MTPKLKFIITEENVCPGGRQVKEPIGWKDIELVLERHPEYYSLIEYFEGEFIWYGDARKLFNEIEAASGPDAIVNLTVYIKFTIKEEYEEAFTGLIDLSLLEELTKQTRPYKIKAPIIRNDFWAKFINRVKTPVDVLSTTSLDGDMVTVEDKFSLPLPTQTIFKNYKIKDSPELANTVPWTIPNGEALVVDFIIEEFNNMEEGEIFTYPVSIYPGIPYEIQKSVAKFNGIRRVRVNVDFYQGTTSVPTAINANLKCYITHSTEARNNLYAVELSRTNITLGGKTWTRFYTDVEYDQLGTDVITVPYLFNSVGSSQIVYMGMPAGAPPDLGTEQYIQIDANTTFAETDTDSLLIKDVGTNILRKIIGQNNVLESDALDGYKGLYALQKVLHIRGKSMTDKPFTISFDQWWKGASPALALGLGYNDDGIIEVEDIGEFFKITPSITFTKVGKISRQYGTEYFYKVIELGFSKWSAESPGGLDDPQSKKSYRLRFKISGKTLTKLSEYYAAGLGLEEARRRRIEQQNDYKLDEEIAIIALKVGEDYSYTPELGSDFESISNLNNSDSRYNVRLLVSRILKRWQPYFQGCLEYYDDEKFYFASGEGNIDALVQFKTTDSERRQEDSSTSGIAENQDIGKGADNLILPNLYKVTGVPITWNQYKTILANRKNAIGVPYNGDTKSMYINKLRYKLKKGSFEADLLETSPTAFDDYMLFQDLVPMAFQDGALMKYN